MSGVLTCLASLPPCYVLCGALTKGLTRANVFDKAIDHFRAHEGTDYRGVDKAITERGCLEIRL